MGSNNAAPIHTPPSSGMSHPFFFYETTAPGKLPIFNSVSYTEPKTFKEMSQSVKEGSLCFRLKEEGSKSNKYVMMQPKDAQRAKLGNPYILREGLKTFQQLNGHATALGQRPDHSLRALNRGTSLLNAKLPATQKAGVKPSPFHAPKPKAGVAPGTPKTIKPAAKPAAKQPHPPPPPKKAAAHPQVPAKKSSVHPQPHAPAHAKKVTTPANSASPVAEAPKKAEPPPPPPPTPPKTDDAAAPKPAEKFANLGPAGLLPVTPQEIKEKVSAPSLRETYKRIEKDLPPSIRYFAMFLGWGDIPQKPKTPEKPAPGLS